MIKPIKHYITNYYKQYRDAIDEILTNFDYEKVHKAMEYLDWKWAVEGDMEYLEVPDKFTIRDRVKQALLNIEDLVSKDQVEYFMSCGGIEVECRSYDFEECRKHDSEISDDFNGCVYLGVKFVLEDWNNAI